jgi:hypothetical protein
MGERRAVHRVLVGKPEKRRPLGRPTSREDNIKIDLLEVRQGQRIDLGQDRERWRALVNAVMNLWVP